MKLENYQADKLKKEVLRIISKHLDLRDYKVFFFGSRINGKAEEGSDIDIGLEGDKSVSLATLAKINEDFEELPIFYKIQAVDFFGADDRFKIVAKEKVEFLN